MAFDFSSLEVPVVAAPMAGGPSTPELVAAVSAAGGFGFLAAGYLTPEAMAQAIDRTRALTQAPFGINVFTPQRRATGLDDDIEEYAESLREVAGQYGVEPGEPTFNDDHFEAKVDYLVDNPVAVVTFTFGAVESGVVRRLREAGSLVGFTVTSADEARRADDLGADFLVAQGAPAGGHRGVWSETEEPNVSTASMVVASVRAVSDLPVVGAGAVTSADDVRALLADGCVAVAVGTLFVASDESGSSETQKEAYTSGRFDSTTLTRAFSGRYARGLTNDFIRKFSDAAPAAYPELHYITSPIRKAATAAGDPEAMGIWAGEGFAAAVRRPAADIIAALNPR